MSSVELPYFEHIDTQLGLKYLNNNRELYLKILNNFLNRYESLNIEDLEEDDFNDTIHSIKGLSATLGMVTLSKLARVLHREHNRKALPDFARALELVMNELKKEFINSKKLTILIISDKREEIDILVGYLGDDNDLIVASNKECFIDVLSCENISLAFLSMNFEKKELFHIYSALENSRVPIVPIIDDSCRELVEFLDIDSIECIKKPIDKERLKEVISRFS